MDQIEDLEKQVKKRDEENARLRRENEQMREEVLPPSPCCTIICGLT